MLVVDVFGHERILLILVLASMAVVVAIESRAGMRLVEARREAIDASAAGKQLKRVREPDEEDDAEPTKSDEQGGRGIPIRPISIITHQAEIIAYMAMILLPTLLPKVRYPI
jgi:hypothetical protein